MSFYPVFNACGTHMVMYWESSYDRGKRGKNPFSDTNKENRTYNGFMSVHTRRELTKKLTVYFEACYSAGKKFRDLNNIHHTLVTLTLSAPQMHTDNEIKKEMLVRWIDRAKKKYGIVFYYWVAEKQKNGSIHFHLLIDKFLEWKWVRKAWNELQGSLGYITVFEQKNGHRDPNSTDIQTIKNMKDAAKYVTKYVTKADQQGGVQGRLHGECDLLREVKKFKTTDFHEMQIVIQEAIDSGILRLITYDHFVIVCGDIRLFFKNNCPKHYKMWQAHHQEIMNHFYPQLLAMAN